MVRPIVEYTHTAWAPYTRKNIQSLGAVHRKAAWFIKNNYGFILSVTAMLQDLWWPIYTFKKKMVLMIFYVIK